MKPRWVQKTAGRVEKFQITKLAKSIYFSLHHIDKGKKNLAWQIAKGTANYLGEKEVVDSGKIREAVLHIMHEKNMSDEAASYELTSLHLKDIPITSVAKRDGQTQDFRPLKLFKSIRRACNDAGIVGGKLSEDITKKVIENLAEETKEGIISSQKIKETAAKVLKEAGFAAVEHKYLIHRYV